MKRKHLKRLLALLLAVATLGLFGCQSGGTTSSGTISSGTASGTTGSTPESSTTEGDTTPSVDPVAQWRVTPTTISQNPADPDFRLDAKNYESIAFPDYDKNNPARLPENTYTDAEKQQQRIAGQQLKIKVTQAVLKKESTLTIEPGVYRFPSGNVPFDLSGASDITFLGEGVELVLEGWQQAFKLNRCKNVTFVGFTVDRDPYRHFQFTVTDYDWDTDILTVEVMEGYDVEGVLSLLPGGAGDDFSLQFFDDDGVWRQQVFTHYTSFEWVDKANRIGRFHGTDPIDPAVDEWLIGTIGSTILPGQFHIINLSYSESCNFVDIVNYGGSMMAMGEGNRGDFYFLRNKNMPRPGTNSLIAGGFGLVEWLDGGPIIEDCVYSRTNDDVIDVLAWNDAVYQQESANTVLVATMKKNCPYEVGNTVRFYKQNEGRLIKEVKITGVEVVTDRALVNGANTALTDGRWQSLGNHESLVRLTLDSEVTVAQADAVENYSAYRPDHIVIKGTLFHDVFCRALLQSAKATTLENNVFMRTGLSSVMMPVSASYGFSEGKTVENILIKGNTFVDGPYSPQTNYSTGLFTGTIAIGTDDPGSPMSNPNRDRLIHNVTIEDNWIIGSMFSAVQVKNVDGLVIRNNRIDSPVTRDGMLSHPGMPNRENPGIDYYGVQQNAAIFLYNCGNITLENNTVNKEGGYCTRDVVRLLCD